MLSEDPHPAPLTKGVNHIPLPLRDTKGTAELCEASDPVCLVLRVKFVNEHEQIYKFG